jgi:hypothetical protein
MMQRGAYPAEGRLSGVALPTVRCWARNDVLVPSISAQPAKFWSYPDLMGFGSSTDCGTSRRCWTAPPVARMAMPAVRRALAQLAELDLRLWSEETEPTVRVDRGGKPFAEHNSRPVGGPSSGSRP